MIDYLATFIVLFAVIDPIGTIPVFIAVTNRHDNAEKPKIALIAALAAAVILIFFALVGELLLSAMGISLPAFQVAGGVVLFIFALSMIFGESKPEEEIRMVRKYQDTAVFPLAIPSIAGPGAILAVVLLTEKTQYSLAQQIQTIGVLLAVIGITYIFMILARSVNRIIGDAGASVISRVMGLILSAVATSNILGGLKTYFAL
ncbi:MAG: MarC family protein [Gammaproteobacteria bacterium]